MVPHGRGNPRLPRDGSFVALRFTYLARPRRPVRSRFRDPFRSVVDCHLHLDLDTDLIMSEASDSFWQAHRRVIGNPGDQETLSLFQQAATKWREQGKHLSAAISMTRAIHAAWGDGQKVNACAEAALRDYEQCLETQPPCSPQNLLALLKCHRELSHYIRVGDKLWAELGNRLLHYSDSPNADSFLVRGFVLSGDLDREWVPSFPPGEISGQVEYPNWVEGKIDIEFPSALRIFRGIPDYQGAAAIIERCPDAFTTPGLRGWRAAVQGFLMPNEAAERFTEAARAFSEDVYDPGRQAHWSSANIDLWAKYFRARAALARIVREPGRAGELLREADSELHGTDSGHVNKDVS